MNKPQFITLSQKKKKMNTKQFITLNKKKNHFFVRRPAKRIEQISIKSKSEQVCSQDSENTIKKTFNYVLDVWRIVASHKKQPTEVNHSR